MEKVNPVQLILFYICVYSDCNKSRYDLGFGKGISKLHNNISLITLIVDLFINLKKISR